MPGPVKNRPLRLLLLALGFFFLGMAFVGTVLPLVPTTGPVILAAFLFSKSSERFDHWLVTNRVFGSIVRDWRAGLGFTFRAKAIAVAAIVASFSISTVFVVDSTIVRVALIALAIAIAAYVVTRPTKQPIRATEPIG